MHSFSGEPFPTDDLTPAKLVADSDDACESPQVLTPSSHVDADHSEYWAPSLHSTNSTPSPWIAPSSVLIYYRNAGVDPNTIVPFDPRFSLKAGDPDATEEGTGEQTPEVMRWSCTSDTPKGIKNSQVNFQATIPTYCPKVQFGDDGHRYPYYLRLVVYFPNCVSFDAAGGFVRHGEWIYNQTAYSTNIHDETKQWTRACTDNLVPIPQVQIGFRWALNSTDGITNDPLDTTQWDLSSLRLSSDMDGQPGGISGHVDFMSGWTAEELSDLVKQCFWQDDTHPGGHPGGMGPQNCGAIGDGTPPGDN